VLLRVVEQRLGDLGEWEVQIVRCLLGCQPVGAHRRHQLPHAHGAPTQVELASPGMGPRLKVGVGDRLEPLVDHAAPALRTNYWSLESRRNVTSIVAPSHYAVRGPDRTSKLSRSIKLGWPHPEHRSHCMVAIGYGRAVHCSDFPHVARYLPCMSHAMSHRPWKRAVAATVTVAGDLPRCEALPALVAAGFLWCRGVLTVRSGASPLGREGLGERVTQSCGSKGLAFESPRVGALIRPPG